MTLEEDIKIEAGKIKLIQTDKETNKWFSYRQKFLDDLKNNDLTNFTKWEGSVGAFVIAENAGSEEHFKELDLNKWEHALKETTTGNIDRASFYPDSSVNMIRYAGHLATFEKRYNKKIEDMETIVEFGGGYGGMCRLVKRLGFKGEYIIYDLPELLLLQKYYLTKEGLMDNTIITDDFSIFNKPHDLLIGTWSVSECPLAMRDEIIKNFKCYIMAFQKNFYGINNERYFNSLKLDIFKENHTPPGSCYCMGVK